MKVFYNVETFPSTTEALKFLRNALATRVFHEIAVIEVPAGEGKCGFLLIDKTLDEVVWSGHSFRENGRGRAGAGHRKMAEIFDTLGVLVKPYDHFSVSGIYPELLYDQYNSTDVETKILNIADHLVQELGEDGYHVPARQPIVY